MLNYDDYLGKSTPSRPACVSSWVGRSGPGTSSFEISSFRCICIMTLTFILDLVVFKVGVGVHVTFDMAV